MKKPVCPRCLNYIPSNEYPGAYPGAISRTDDKTEVCSECGVNEAMEMFFESIRPDQSGWPTVNWYENKIEASSDEELSEKLVGFLIGVSHNKLLPISIREKAKDYIFSSAEIKDQKSFIEFMTDAVFEITPPGWRLVGSYESGKSTYYYVKEHSGRTISQTN
jgi:hypothetical protein